jgi:hypothetical protein
MTPSTFRAAALLTGLLCGVAAQAGEPIVQFNGAIGVDPVAGISNGAPVINTVRGVAPGGRAWVLRKLRARVDADGSLSAKGSGLLFAGGDAIGSRGAVAAVRATLFCGAGLGVASDSATVALDERGNFAINGPLTPVPASPCLNPVLLIRNGNAAGAWFAAGIPSEDDD